MSADREDEGAPATLPVPAAPPASPTAGTLPDVNGRGTFWGVAGGTIEYRRFRAGLAEGAGPRSFGAWPVEPQNPGDSGLRRASPGAGILPRSLPFKRCRRGGAAARAPP